MNLADKGEFHASVPYTVVATPPVVEEVLQLLHALAAEFYEHGGEVERSLNDEGTISPAT